MVAELVRSGFVEGRHHGSVIALAPDGSTVYAVGDVDAPMLPRSCNKPLQAVGMLRAGLTLPARLLALAAASHSGERIHVDGVREILAAGRELLAYPIEPLPGVEQAEVRTEDTGCLHLLVARKAG